MISIVYFGWRSKVPLCLNIRIEQKFFKKSNQIIWLSWNSSWTPARSERFSNFCGLFWVCDFQIGEGGFRGYGHRVENFTICCWKLLSLLSRHSEPFFPGIWLSDAPTRQVHVYDATPSPDLRTKFGPSDQVGRMPGPGPDALPQPILKRPDRPTRKATDSCARVYSNQRVTLGTWKLSVSRRSGSCCSGCLCAAAVPGPVQEAYMNRTVTRNFC